MPKKREKMLWATVIVAALSLGAVAFTSMRKAPNRSAITLSRRLAENPIALANSKSESYVHMGSLWPQLRQNLKALGDRLEKPGKERVTVAGMLIRGGVTQPVSLILQFPDRLRLETAGTGLHHITTFNGKSAATGTGSIDQGEQDLIETLVYDTAEHFFGGQLNGVATRSLGEYFRLDDGTQANSTGPLYDIYQTNEAIKHAVPQREQTKIYCFNSESHLLESIKYELSRDASRTAVEVRIGNWQKVQDQQVPFRIVRLENNVPVFTLTINSAVLSTKLDDGAFGR